jgi:hypothetical protein
LPLTVSVPVGLTLEPGDSVPPLTATPGSVPVPDSVPPLTVTLLALPKLPSASNVPALTVRAPVYPL